MALNQIIQEELNRVIQEASKEYNKEYYNAKRREQRHAYTDEKKQEISTQQKKYRQENKDKIKQQRHQHYLDNADEIKQRQRNYEQDLKKNRPEDYERMRQQRNFNAKVRSALKSDFAKPKNEVDFELGNNASYTLNVDRQMDMKTIVDAIMHKYLSQTEIFLLRHVYMDGDMTIEEAAEELGISPTVAFHKERGAINKLWRKFNYGNSKESEYIASFLTEKTKR